MPPPIVALHTQKVVIKFHTEKLSHAYRKKSGRPSCVILRSRYSKGKKATSITGPVPGTR